MQQPPPAANNLKRPRSDTSYQHLPPSYAPAPFNLPYNQSPFPGNEFTTTPLYSTPPAQYSFPPAAYPPVSMPIQQFPVPGAAPQFSLPGGSYPLSAPAPLPPQPPQFDPRRISQSELQRARGLGWDDFEHLLTYGDGMLRPIEEQRLFEYESRLAKMGLSGAGEMAGVGLEAFGMGVGTGVGSGMPVGTGVPTTTIGTGVGPGMPTAMGTGMGMGVGQGLGPGMGSGMGVLRPIPQPAVIPVTMDNFSMPPATQSLPSQAPPPQQQLQPRQQQQPATVNGNATANSRPGTGDTKLEFTPEILGFLPAEIQTTLLLTAIREHPDIYFLAMKARHEETQKLAGIASSRQIEVTFAALAKYIWHEINRKYSGLNDAALYSVAEKVREYVLLKLRVELLAKVNDDSSYELKRSALETLRSIGESCWCAELRYIDRCVQDQEVVEVIGEGMARVARSLSEEERRKFLAENLEWRNKCTELWHMWVGDENIVVDMEKGMVEVLRMFGVRV